MKFLVTGGGGYLGAVLTRRLAAAGHSVTVFDAGYFGLHHLKAMRGDIKIQAGDLRTLTEDPVATRALLDGCDAIFHLAAVSNDPSADLAPDMTEQVNCVVTHRLAEAAKETSTRFVFASSASVYGDAEGEQDEASPLQPLSLYARSKVAGELSLMELAADDWKPAILRMGTLFGLSPRMRFDLVVNIFSLHIRTQGRLRIMGDGQQWRPYLHVEDAARAFEHFATLPDLNGSVFNVSHHNLTVVDVAAAVASLDPTVEITHVDLDQPDHRSYQMDTGRLLATGFVPTTDVATGATEIVAALDGGVLVNTDGKVFRNATWMKEVVLAAESAER